MGLQRLRHDWATEQQQHVHWVSDAIQPSHPLWVSSPLAHNLICRADIENRREHSGSKGCCCSVTQLCPTLCDPMDCGTSGFPVFHYFLEFSQIYVHWVSDAIQWYHLLLSPSLPAFNIFQHQGLFQSVSSLHQVAKVLELQHQYFQWIIRVDALGLTGLVLQSKGISRVFSNNAVQKHQFFSAQASLWSKSHICTWLSEKP